MKNRFLLLILCAMTGIACAQNADQAPDTIFDGYNSVFITWSILTDSNTSYYWHPTVGTYYNPGAYTLDSVSEGITIYGMALSVAMIHEEDPRMEFPATDTSRDDWVEYTRLYKPIGDSMVLLGEAPFNQFATPNYLLPPHKMLSTKTPRELLDNPAYIYGPDSMQITPPLFETYFDKGFYITDSFYFGTTGNYFWTGKLWYDIFRIDVSYTMPIELWYMERTYKQIHSLDGSWIRNFIHWHGGMYIFFPILTPDPNRSTPTPVDTVLNYFDTTTVDPGHGADTTQVDDTAHSAVYSPQMLERYTQLLPSAAQAGQEVAVLSSFHLQALEVYDAAGRLVHSQPASGIAATLSTAALPRGNYLVRLLTTAGPTTKKLVLR